MATCPITHFLPRPEASASDSKVGPIFDDFHLRVDEAYDESDLCKGTGDHPSILLVPHTKNKDVLYCSQRVIIDLLVMQ